MIERQILQALQTATIAAVAASTIPTLGLQVLGRTFNPPNDGKWLEIVHIPNNVTGEFWGDEKTYRGLYRLILHWPVDDAGSYPPLDVLASVTGYFAKGRTFQNGGVSVKITEQPDLTGVIENAPERLYPATIRYQSFQT